METRSALRKESKDGSKSLETSAKVKCSPILIDCLINDIYYVKAMVDIGCLCYAVFDQNLVRKFDLKTREIAPQLLRLADGKTTTEITSMAKINLDTDGR